MSSDAPALVAGRKVVLVGVVLSGQPLPQVEEHLDELEDLAKSAGATVVARSVQNRSRPHASTFIGPGKAEALRGVCAELGADLLIFDDDLSPSQAAKLEELAGQPVLDRSGLILEIFRSRARSREARTQVELAHLEYQLPRLTRRWSHLSRQAGGIGVRGGEGETQLEADRRMLRQRIRKLKKDLAKIERTRSVQRAGRRRTASVALAGYTNAGKSSLFNRLTHGDVLVEDRVFATLDSRLRRGSLGGRDIAVFADTVGFIRKLPHHLVASFRGTLEEVAEADLVLHVMDRSHPSWQEQRRIGNEVLAELGVDSSRVLEVFNKMDRAGSAVAAEDAIGVSATTGRGLDELRQTVRERLFGRAAEAETAQLDSQNLAT